MIGDMADWLLERLELVPLVPLVGALLCIALKSVFRLSYDLKIALFIVSAALLFGVYAFAFYRHSPMLVLDIIFFAPQSVLLLIIASIVFIRKVRDSQYIPPSPWWIVAIVAIGCMWTSTCTFALGT